VADRLTAVLERSRSLGFLGPGPVDAHVLHATGFVAAWERYRHLPPGTCCDLGAGGGVPGLALAQAWPATSVVLLEAMDRRCRFLEGAIDELGLGPRVSVAEGRAELLARSAALEGRFQLIVARSFGPPAATAECAARLLAPGGLVVVSEPPLTPDGEAGDGPRWPDSGLGVLGLRLAGRIDAPSFVVIERVDACPEPYPRRNGLPAKRPLF
jgi:16S rRNA (guanine527-N7)-methyltransferase